MTTRARAARGFWLAVRLRWAHLCLRLALWRRDRALRAIERALCRYGRGLRGPNPKLPRGED